MRGDSERADLTSDRRSSASLTVKTSDFVIRGLLTFVCWGSLDSVAPPSELLEMCEQSLEEMGAVFDDANVYMLNIMYQAMGVCLYMQDPDGAIRYGEKIAKCYRFNATQTFQTSFFFFFLYLFYIWWLFI